MGTLYLVYESGSGCGLKWHPSSFVRLCLKYKTNLKTLFDFYFCDDASLALALFSIYI